MIGVRRAVVLGLLLAGCAAPLPTPVAQPGATATATVQRATTPVPVASLPTMNPTSTPRREPTAPLPEAIKPTTAALTSMPKSAPPPPPPAATATGDAQFKFRREGGFAGFCDELHILPGDMAVRYSCKSGRLQELGRRRLTPDESRVLQVARQRLQPLSVVQRDKAVADAMTVTIVLQGVGAKAASAAEQAALIAFANELLASAFDTET